MKKIETKTAPSFYRISEHTDFARFPSGDLRFYGVRNEYENCQLIVCGAAAKDALLETAPLRGERGAIEESAFTVYRENFSRIGKGSEFSAAYEKGLYADALIEQKFGFDKFTSLEDTAVFWVTLKIPETCPAGRYGGRFLLKAGGVGKEIGVTAEVADFTLSDKSTMQTSFGVFCDYLDPAYETDGEFLELCYKQHLEYRLNAFFHFRKMPPAEAVADFVDRHFDDPRFTRFGLPDYRAQERSVRIGAFKDMILALAARSSPRRNLLSKIYAYFFDEPEGNRIVEAVERDYDRYRAMLQSAVDAVREDRSAKYAAFRQIEGYEECILKIPNLGTLLVDTYGGKMQENTGIWCPAFAGFTDEYTIEAEKALCRAAGGELWWYGCMGPTYPYPTYHLADRLFSSRAASWMQYYYGIEGNLYWRSYGVEENELEKLDNFSGEKPESYKPFGDGFLFYYGSAVGQKEPLPSIRLMSIRDGIEEYELLAALQKKYEGYAEIFAPSFDPARATKIVAGKLFRRVYAKNDGALFEKIRRELIEKVSAGKTIPYAVGDIRTVRNRAAVYLYTVRGAKIYIDGAPAETDAFGRAVYEYDLRRGVKTAEIALEKDGVTERYTEIFSDYFDLFDALSCEECKRLITANRGRAEIAVSYLTVFRDALSKSAKISLSYTGEEHPEICFDLRRLGREYFEGLRTISLSVYNCESRSLTVYGRFCGESGETEAEARELFDNRSNVLNFEWSELKDKAENADTLKLVFRNTYPEDAKKDMKIVVGDVRMYYLA